MENILGRLHQVDLRNIWLSEAQHFTPWLAREENLELLSEALGLELELEAQERIVGEFRADILCKDLGSDQWVLIENQLERTDHGHLGQLLTYAAGLQAVTIVWIAARFADAHRAALDWLNDITDERFRFFGLEVELWKIGDSQAAPKFNIVSKPNEWARSVGQAARQIDTEAMTDLRKAQVEFWTGLGAFLINRRSALKPQKPSPQQWMTLSIGRSGYHLNALYIASKKRIGVDFNIIHSRAHAAMSHFEGLQDVLDAELGESTEWIRSGKQARIVIFRDVSDPYDRSKWPEYFDWIANTLNRFDATFRQRVRALPDFSDESLSD